MDVKKRKDFQMTNDQEKKIREILVELYNAETGTELNEERAVNKALASILALEPKMMGKEELIRIIRPLIGTRFDKSTSEMAIDLTVKEIAELDEYTKQNYSRQIADAILTASKGG